MATKTRKQREVEQREALILQVARKMLRTQGYLGLRMDDIANEVEYSKGTIYQHFANKEEIILALANQALLKRTALFSHAVTMRSRSRERLAAVAAAAELFVEGFPYFFQVEQIIRIESILQKTSQQRRAIMRSCESRCMSIISGVVRDAMAQGELTLPDGCTPEDVVFGLWSISVGAFGILSSSDSLPEIGIVNPITALRRNQNAMLDGYGWQPLSSECDFDQVLEDAKRELQATSIMQDTDEESGRIA